MKTQERKENEKRETHKNGKGGREKLRKSENLGHTWERIKLIENGCKVCRRR